MRRTWPAVLLGLMLLGAYRGRSEKGPSRPLRVDLPQAAFPELEPVFDLPLNVLSEVELPLEAGSTEEAPCPATLRWLLNSQNDDGSWGGGPTFIDGVLISRTGMTGLALLAMTGAGFSHLSKEEWDGLSMGAAVRRGLLFLVNDQGADGLFRSARGGLDQAVATHSLGEIYALTGSNLFKGSAQAGIDALAAQQLRDGSWGDGPSTFWAADALRTAELSGLTFPRNVYDGLRALYDRRGAPDAREMIARIFMDKNKADPLHSHVAWMLVASPPTTGRALHDVYIQSRALFQYDGPAGPKWKAWIEPFKAAIVQRAAPGGRSDRVVHESLSALCLETYYCYTNVFGSK